MLPMCREFLSDADNTNVFASKVLSTTRLSERSSPERLVAVHDSPKGLENSHNGLHIFHGDNDIIPVDTHLLRE